MNQRTTFVTMPRFKMAADFELGRYLRNLGTIQAFDRDAADFSAMSTSTQSGDGFFISEVLHKAFFEVNEKGAEAAAVTAIVVKSRSAPTRFESVPFLFVIRDRQTGTILFLGRMARPA